MTDNGNSTSSRKKRKTDSGSNPPDPDSAHPKEKRKWLPKIGRLSKLMNMPMDILFEIFGHLRPLDVLNLSRTTKEFRRILMHRSSTSVWKAARANIPDFPDCPPEMSEPQWAHLAFYPSCNICFAPGIRNVDWHLRVRLCSKCSKEHVEEQYKYSYDFLSCHNFVPYRESKRNRIAYFRDDYLAIKAKYEALEGPELRRSYLNERQNILNETKKHTLLCEKWASAQAQGRSKELQELKSSRKKDIIERLTALGWGDEIDKIPYHDDLGNHRLVKAPQQLTERVWNNIRKELTEYMEHMKTQRLARELAALISARKGVAANILRNHKMSRLPFMSVLPKPHDFCLFPAIKAIIEEPGDVDIDESSFADVVPLLPSMLEEWRASITKQLARKMRKQEGRKEGSTRFTGASLTKLEDESCEDDDSSLSDEVVEKMKLATTVFNCRMCDLSLSDDDSDDDDSDDDEFYVSPYQTTLLFYPAVLSHHCLTQRRSFSLFDVLGTGLDISSDQQKWTCKYLELDTPTGMVVEGVVKACGLNPATATATDMDQLDPRFACLLCISNKESASVLAFGWRFAIRHSIKRHHSRQGWYKLSPDEEAQARQAEPRSLSRPSCYNNFQRLFGQDVWLCLHCLGTPRDGLPVDMETIQEHLLFAHEIPVPTLDRDYARDFAAPQIDQPTSPLHSSYVSIKLPTHDDSPAFLC